MRNHYVIGGSVALLYRGLPVFAGEFGTWVPRGVEMIGGIYKLVWQNGSNNEFSIWDVDSQKPTSQLVGHTGTVAALACDSTGNVLVSGSYDTTLCIWNLVTKKQIPATALRAPAGEAR